MRRMVAAAAVMVVGSLVSAASPAQAAGGPWSVVSSGDNHTCAISTGRSLFCWGYNGFGQIGDGTSGPGTDQQSPTRIGAIGVWAKVSAGGAHTCAISTAKSLYCWGNNAYGRIGDGTVDQRPSPKKVGATGAWVSVSAGAFHTCAIATGQSLYCWGRNNHGQLGDGTGGPPDTNRHSPKKIGASGVWAGVAAGNLHTCGISTGRSLYCWGYNFFGQIGDGSSANERYSPKKVGSTGAWATAATGSDYTCAISTGKSLYCWGENSFGQIGDGTTTPRPSPKKIGASGAWIGLTLGDTHTCATSTGKSLYCWGENSFGQIGDGTTTPRLSPKKVGASGAWSGTTAGAYHSCAIATGQSLYCWGRNASGQIGDGTTTSRVSPRKVA